VDLDGDVAFADPEREVEEVPAAGPVRGRFS
jgi:hypothetical protein